MIKEIIAITGKPGLYKLVSHSSKMLIVEALDGSKKRMPIYAANQVAGLGDISVYINDGTDIPLAEVFESIKAVAGEGKKVDGIDYKKASANEIIDWFKSVLPNYDTDRVHISDMRKIMQWYNILVQNGIVEYSEKKEKTEE